MDPLRLALALLVLLAGCHRRRSGGRHPRDPRMEFATGCVDQRYVSSPASDLPVAQPEDVTSVATARLGAQRLVAWATPSGVSVWREGAPASVRITPPAQPGGFALAATSERFVLAWVDARSSAIQFAAMDASLSARVWPPVARDARQPALAAGPRGALLAWTEGATVRARMLDGQGRSVGETVTLASGRVDAPAVTWTGQRFVVAWRVSSEARSSVAARAVTPDGTLSSAFEAVRAEGLVGPPALAWGGGRLALAWSDHRNGDLGLQVTTVDLSGRALDEPQKLSIRFQPEARGAIAWDGAAFGVAWSEPVGGARPRSYMALVDRRGRRIGTSMRLVVDPGEASLEGPTIAWERPNYVLVATRGGDVVELRRTGPRGCDMPLVRAPAAR